MPAKTGMVAVMHCLGMVPSDATVHGALVNGVPTDDVVIEGFSKGWKKLSPEDKEDLKKAVGNFDIETGTATGTLTY